MAEGFSQIPMTGSLSNNALRGQAVNNNLNGMAGANSLSAQTGMNGSQPMMASAQNNALAGNTNSMALKANVVEQMKDHDVVLILDRSGSMSERDCQGLSRWDWVGRQSNELAQAAQQASSDLTLMIFSSDFEVLQHVNPQIIPSVFRRSRPGGGTMLGAPLDAAFKHYFDARQNNPATKPLIIVVITDGMPTDFPRVRDRIYEAANATKTDGEISLTFLLVNGELSGNFQMEMLDGGLHTQRDIVNLVEFDQLLSWGVKKSLFEALSGRQMKNHSNGLRMTPFIAPLLNNPMMGLTNLLRGNSP